jgi:hypothetical protein
MTESKTNKAPIGAEFESVKVRTAERERFDTFMSNHVAQLTGYAQPYVGRLPALEKELFLARALNAAWEKRNEFVPGKENAGLLVWWEKCLKQAALSRGTWHQVYQDDVRTIRGVDLGRK